MSYIFVVIRKYWSITIIILISLFIFTYALINENSVVLPIHDNLDIYIDVYKVLRDNNLFFKHNITAPFLGGIDRDFLPSELKLYSICYILFRPYIAYHFAYVIRVIISIVGFILCNKYIVKNKNINITILVGFIYALLPYYPHQSIGFASLPFIVAICYKSFNELRFQIIIILLCSAFLFDFVFHGIFICGYILLFFIILSITYKRVHLNSLITLSLIILSFLITEYRFFGLLIFKRVPFHRIEQVGNYSKSIKQIYMSFVEVFRLGHYHSSDIHYLIVYLIVMFAVSYTISMIVVINCKDIKTMIKRIFTNPLLISFVFIVFNCIIYALDGNFYFKNIVTALFKSLKGFHFSRTIWFNPFLWYFSMFYILSITFAHNLGVINKAKNTTIYLILIYLICRLLIYPSTYNEIHGNIFKKQDNLTFHEFFSENLFFKIKKDIDYNKNQKCICLGLHPSIAIYNGFYCLDGYFNIYPLEIKQNFRRIIAPSLNAAGSKYKDYYDNWGNRVYLFCDDIDYNQTKSTNANPVILKLNSVEFKNYGGKYIISRVPILNINQLGLSFVNKYTDETSPYCIYIYKN